MITITTEPDSIPWGAVISDPKPPPVPVSECLRWCLQADAADAVQIEGSRATVTVALPPSGSTTIPANGTAFSIWGYDFEVDDSTPFTASSFQVTTNTLTNFANFVGMIEANIFFRRAVSVSAALVAPNLEITITWLDCREQPRFVAESMDLDVFTTIGGSASFANGVSPQYTPGFRVVARPLLFDEDAEFFFNEIGVLEGLEVDRLCDSVGEVCVNYQKDAQSQLWTELPELSASSFTTAERCGQTMLRLFALEYGWTYQEDCVAKSGTFMKSDLVPVLNAALDPNDPYGMRRYWSNHPDGFPPGVDDVEFLTTQPKGYTVCNDAFMWLWFLNNMQETWGKYELYAQFRIHSGANIETLDYKINDPDTDASEWRHPVCFNASPQFIYDNAVTYNTPGTVDYYEVSVYGLPADPNDQFHLTERIKIVPTACCGDTADVYFLTSPGGIGTLSVNIDEREMVQEGTEVNLFVPCDVTQDSRARYGGRTLVNLRSYERVTFSAKHPKRDAQWVKWFADFKKSPQKWLRVDDGFGGYVAKKLIIEPGAIKISKRGESIELTATGYLADVPAQNPAIQ